MNGQIALAIADLLPLRIDQVAYSDPSFILSGDGWSLSLTCPWRVRREGGQLWFSWSSSEMSDLVRELIGMPIDDVQASAAGDLVVDLSGGVQLEAFADTDLDPLILRLPTHVFVGSASSHDT